jgi:hypothetical protein
MYALIHKNKVISGPRDWTKPLWVTLLKQRGVSNILIPRNPIEELPHIIDENTKICRATVIQEPINTMTQYYQGPTWDLSGDVAIANYDIIETPIEFARGNFKELAKIERRKKEVTTIKVTVQDTEVTVSTDRDERSVFITKLSLVGENDTVNWKFPESWLVLTRADLLFIITSVDNHVQSTFDWEKDINDQIDAAQTSQELLDIIIVQESNLQNRPRRIEEE